MCDEVEPHPYQIQNKSCYLLLLKTKTKHLWWLSEFLFTNCFSLRIYRVFRSVDSNYSCNLLWTITC
jgi:hypothetical protein